MRLALPPRIRLLGRDGSTTKLRKRNSRAANVSNAANSSLHKMLRKSGDSTKTLTASSGSTSQKVLTSLFCPMPMSKGSRTNSTLARERYSATKPLARFSSALEICPLHFTVQWASHNRELFSKNREFSRRSRELDFGTNFLTLRELHVATRASARWHPQQSSARRTAPQPSRGLARATRMARCTSMRDEDICVAIRTVFARLPSSAASVGATGS